MSGMYCFARMSDSKSVIQFVKDIENHPCLYNTKLHEYVNHGLKRKTWMHIAKKWNCTVAECKEKWRKIRTAYSRSLKPKYRNNRWLPSRPYYLASYLKFISPKNISATGKDLPPSKRNDVKIEVEPEVKNDALEDSDEKLDTQDEDPEETLENDSFHYEDEEFLDDNDTLMDSEKTISNEFTKITEVNIRNSPLRDNRETIKNDVKTKEPKDVITENNHRKGNHTNEVNKVKEVEVCKIRNNHNSERNEQRCSYCANIESKPRKMLLFSLLPDIEALSEQQMRVFRRELIDLIDKCKYDLNDV